MGKTYSFESLIYSSEVGKGGAYVVFPYDIRKEFGAGRVKVQAMFDGVSYEGSSICYILGIRKDIRKKIGKDIGDRVNVTIELRE